ncbi:MAG: DUF45 domain-containing protein [Desulfovibrionaceae bacterium]|nr:DUF45 domain-containing protein [Desulfovibrionaceae bacterium]
MNSDEDSLLLPTKVFFSYADGQCLIMHMQLSNTATKVGLSTDQGKVTALIPANYERENLPEILETCAHYLDGAHFTALGLNKNIIPTELPLPIEGITYQILCAESLDAAYQASLHAKAGAYVEIDGQRMAWLEFPDEHKPKLILYGSLMALPLGDTLKNWAKEKAQTLLPPFCQELATSLGIHIDKIRIGDQRTRWGSCSYNSRTQEFHISLNWRSVLLPKSLVTELCTHELCHTKYMNHSHAFHAALRKVNRHADHLEEAIDMVVSDLPWWCSCNKIL